MNYTLSIVSMTSSEATYMSDMVAEGYRINKAGNFVPFVDSSSQIFMEDAINGMLNPPINLVQSYMTCTESPLDAALSALGIAFSNTAIVTGILFSLFLSLVAKIYKRCLHKNDQKSQVLSKDQKSSIFKRSLGILLKDMIAISKDLETRKQLENLWMQLENLWVLMQTADVVDAGENSSHLEPMSSILERTVPIWSR